MEGKDTFYCDVDSNDGVDYIICECGETFPSEDELKEHLERKHINIEIKEKDVHTEIPATNAPSKMIVYSDDRKKYFANKPVLKKLISYSGKVEDKRNQERVIKKETLEENRRAITKLIKETIANRQDKVTIKKDPADEIEKPGFKLPVLIKVPSHKIPVLIKKRVIVKPIVIKSKPDHQYSTQTVLTEVKQETTDQQNIHESESEENVVICHTGEEVNEGTGENGEEIIPINDSVENIVICGTEEEIEAEVKEEVVYQGDVEAMATAKWAHQSQLEQEHNYLKSIKMEVDEFYFCEVCGKSFTSENSVTKHLARMHLHRAEMRPRGQKGKKVVCEVCGKNYASNAALRYHQRVHTGERPYKCTMCPKSFTMPLFLQVHIRVHTGERPYQCNQCTKAFSNKAALLRHDRVHSGEKPYTCPYCSKAFTQSNSMKLHVQTVHLKMPAPYKSRARKLKAMSQFTVEDIHEIEQEEQQNKTKKLEPANRVLYQLKKQQIQQKRFQNLPEYEVTNSMPTELVSAVMFQDYDE